MKKIIIGTVTILVFITTLNAGAFEKKYEMMDSRIHSKMEKYQGNEAAQDFLTKKLACVKAGKTVEDLKACKKKYHPKDLKKLVNQ